MTDRRAAALAFLAGPALLALLCGPAAAGEPRAVIELFTSQGCSSCPPADEVLGELAHDPSIVAMSLSIDYWDYLGWKDTLALQGHTNRQRAYARVRGDRDVYTPQVVVNGIVHVLGSDKAAIERAIAQSRSDAAPLSLPVTLSVADGKVTVDVPAGKDERGMGEVWLCPVTQTIPVAVGRGENSGHTLTYHNVVRRWIKLGDWSGKAERFSLPVADVMTSPDVNEVAVVLQSGVASAPGAMLGAAVVPLR